MDQIFYHNLYKGAMIFAIVMLVLAVILFFVLKIYKVFMDLTGISLKRAIREMDEDADYTTRLNRKRRSKEKREKIMTKTGQINIQPEHQAQAAVAIAPPPTPPGSVAETSVLGAGNVPEAETALLSNTPAPEAETALLSNTPAPEAETTLLSNMSAPEAETALLSNGVTQEINVDNQGQDDVQREIIEAGPAKPEVKIRFTIERKVMHVHTEEVI